MENAYKGTAFGIVICETQNLDAQLDLTIHYLNKAGIQLNW